MLRTWLLNLGAGDTFSCVLSSYSSWPFFIESGGGRMTSAVKVRAEEGRGRAGSMFDEVDEVSQALYPYANLSMQRRVFSKENRTSLAFEVRYYTILRDGFIRRSGGDWQHVNHNEPVPGESSKWGFEGERGGEGDKVSSISDDQFYRKIACMCCVKAVMRRAAIIGFLLGMIHESFE